MDGVTELKSQFHALSSSCATTLMNSYFSRFQEFTSLHNLTDTISDNLIYWKGENEKEEEMLAAAKKEETIGEEPEEEEEEADQSTVKEVT